MLTLCGSAVSRQGPARPGTSLAGPFPTDPIVHAPILLLQIGSESNIGSTLVVPYSFDPEFDPVVPAR